MRKYPFKELNNSVFGKVMLKAWKEFIKKEDVYSEDSIETADFYAGFKYAWDELNWKIENLEKRIKLAEDCMARSWELSIIPNGSEVVRPLIKYRESYPEVYKEIK